MLENELAVAESVARVAGLEIMRIYESDFVVNEKSQNSNYSEPVTKADIASSNLILESLGKEFPKDAFLSEEEPDDTQLRINSNRVWIIDPLDGTKGFINKEGDFAVQIALIENGIPVLGIVFQPVNQLLYSAVKGKGATLSDSSGKLAKLLVSNKTHFSNMILASSRAHRNPRMDTLINRFNFKDEIRHGSVGLKVGLLAQSKADIYIHLSPYTKFWDSAAPQVIIEEAGGEMTDLFGKKIDYTLADIQNHNGLIATNGTAHDAAIETLRPILAEFNRYRILPSSN